MRPPRDPAAPSPPRRARPAQAGRSSSAAADHRGRARARRRPAAGAAAQTRPADPAQRHRHRHRDAARLLVRRRHTGRHAHALPALVRSTAPLGCGAKAGGERISAHLHPRPDPSVSSPPRALARRPYRRHPSCPAHRRTRPRARRPAARGKALRPLAGTGGGRHAQSPRRRRAKGRWPHRRPDSSRLALASRPSARRPPVTLRSGCAGRPRRHPRCRRDSGARPRAGPLRSVPTRLDAGGCLCRTQRRDRWPGCRDAGRGDGEAWLVPYL